MKNTDVKYPENPIDDSPMFKMKELVAATGVSKATILYYIREGLLPKPVKTSTNVAFYPASLVERIAFIKQLQAKYRLSLAQIRMIVKEKEKGREVSPLIELNEVIFGQEDEVSYDREAYKEMTGLSVESLKDALNLRLIKPKQENRFDAEDVSVGRMLKRIEGLGLSLSQLDFYPEMARKIVEQEVEIRKEIVRDRPFDEMLSLTMEITGIARSFRGYVIDRIFQDRVSGEDLKAIRRDKERDEV